MSAPPDEVRDDLDEVARLIAPLGSATRLRLLKFLRTPHYIEDIASHLGISRQAARKHLDQLVDIGVLERRPGDHRGVIVTEYAVSPAAIFLVYDQFEKLGALRVETAADFARTAPIGGDAGPKPARGPVVTIVRGVGVGETIELPASVGARWVIGRDAGSDLRFPHDPYVSGRHALLTRADDGYRLTDLRSRNGTGHNWADLARGAEVRLEHGDLVRIGKTLLLFWDRTARR